MSQAEEGREPRNEGTSLMRLFQALENPRNQMSSYGTHPWAYIPAFLLTRNLIFPSLFPQDLGMEMGWVLGPCQELEPSQVKHCDFSSTPGWECTGLGLKVSLLLQALEKD